MIRQPAESQHPQQVPRYADCAAKRKESASRCREKSRNPSPTSPKRNVVRPFVWLLQKDIHATVAGPRARGNKRDIVREAEAAEIREGALASGLTPVEYMLAVMRDPTALPDRRDRMAAAAAPFIHPRLNAIDARVDVRQHTVHDTSAADVLGLKRKFFGVGEELPALPGLDEDGKPGEGG